MGMVGKGRGYERERWWRINIIIEQRKLKIVVMKIDRLLCTYTYFDNSFTYISRREMSNVNECIS